MSDLLTLTLMAAAFVAICIITFFLSRYKRCPPDRVLVVYGSFIKGGKSCQCIHGGGTFILPVVQDYSYMSLTPMTISIPLRGALSLKNIRIDVPSTFTVGISRDPVIQQNAAERLRGLVQKQIEDMAQEIIFGQLRLTVASLTIEQINQDREMFLDSISKNVEPELLKIGLYLINVNITDITDESNYIESIGKKAASEAINRAKIDVAEQEKLGAIGESDAAREMTIRVAENEATAQKGKKKADADRRIYVNQQEAEAVTGENLSQAQIAERNAELTVRQAEAQRLAVVAQQEAEVKIQQARYLAEQERLNAEIIVQKEMEKRNIEIMAQADAQRLRLVAKGEADAVLLKYEAEAEGIRKVLEAKAKGYGELVQNAGDAKGAATLLMIEKIEEVVAKQVEAIKNIKIDKVTVWDSGNSKDGSSTSNFLSNMIKSVPPLHDVAAMAGVELPTYLGNISNNNQTIQEEPDSQI
ncbi:MAG: flotillin family protein [Lentisphaeria bacterium]